MLRLAQLPHYAALMRIEKPIGILLLLWPTLWALCLASHGKPHLYVLFIFISGVFLMRSAGCVVNDLADRRFDGKVSRTKLRPLVTGVVSVKEALCLAGLLAALSFSLVLFCNGLTIRFALLGALLTICYPFLKRITHLPQLGLGLAFSWGVPMAFAAENNEVTGHAWFFFITCTIWPVIYDTLYAMVDREDDLKIGVKSTAILFAGHDRLIIAILQIIFLTLLVFSGFLFHLSLLYYVGLIGVAGCFLYQQLLIKDRKPETCFAAFLNHHWVGLIIFMGIYVSFIGNS